MNRLSKFLRKFFESLPASLPGKPGHKKNDFELLVSSVRDYAIIMLDINGRVTSWNSGAEAIKGYTAEEITGKSFEIFYTKEDIYKGEPRHSLNMAKTHGHYEKNAWRVKKDGTSFLGNIVITSLKDNSGKLLGYTKIVRDVTNTKKAQEQLELFSKQIDQSNDSIYTVDANYRITSWNRGSEKLYGYTKEEALGKMPNELLQTEITEQDMSVALQTINETGYWSGEFRRKTKAGKIIYVRSSTSDIKDADGTLTGMIGVSFDITAQKELQMQVNHLATIVEQSTDGINSTDVNRRFISWNRGCEKMFGYSKEEVIGKTAAEIGFIDQSAAESAEFFEAVMKNGSVTAERQFIRKNGSMFYGTATANAVKDEKGETSGIVFVIKDISIRKQLEEQLKKTNEELEQEVKERTHEVYKSEKRFRALVENNHSIITLFDKNWIPIYRSPAAERITGWTETDRKTISIFEQLHPEQKVAITSIAEQVIQNPGKPYFFTSRSLHKNGHYIWLEGVLTNMIHDPDVGGIISNLHDITERMNAQDAISKSEILYRSLFENLLNGFAYCKGVFKDGALIDFVYLTVNAQYENTILRKNIIGRKYSELFPGLLESHTMYIEIFGRVAMSGIPEKFETHARHLDKWLAVSVYSPENEYFVMLIDDISERKQSEQEIIILNTELEERVAKRTEQLKKINEELETFSYTVSHDLRAPLRGIIGFTSILEEEYVSKLDDEARRITSVIRNNTIKMGHLIDSLLSFSRMGRQDLVKTNFDTGKMISEIIRDSVLPREDMPGINWVIHSMPAITADVSTIRQVWVNLISNAIKYTGKSANPMIEIGSFLQDSNMVFFIKDNGVGFDEKYRNKLFGVFQRLHNDDDFEGTGIGLAIVEKIISRHDGEVWAQAEVNKGACFYFSLPFTFKIKRNNNNEKSTHHEPEFNRPSAGRR